MISLVFILAMDLHLTTTQEMCYMSYKVPSKTITIESKRNRREPWEQNANVVCSNFCEERGKDRWKLKLQQTYDCSGECSNFGAVLNGPKRNKTCECAKMRVPLRDKSDFQNDKDKKTDDFLDGIAGKGHEIYKGYELEVAKLEGLGTYEFGRTKTTFVKANCICKSRGKQLLVLNSKAEADAIHKWWGKMEPGRKSSFLFLGFTNFRNFNHFETVTGVRLEDTGYLVWGLRQPNANRAEDCLSLHVDKTLHDIGCMKSLHYVCEDSD